MQRKEPTIGALDLDYAPPASRVEDGVDTSNAPRKPWVALVWGILCTPVGFAYAGRFVWAVAWTPATLVLLVVIGQSGFVQSVAGPWIFHGFAIAGILAGALLPRHFAKAGARKYQLAWFNHWYVYLPLAVVCTAPSSYVFKHKQQLLGFETFRIPSAGMDPTLMIGDLIVTDTRADTVARLKPGDVVTFNPNEKPDQTYVKRIVAGPGQHVRIEKDGLKVDGKAQSHAHTQGDDWSEAGWFKHPDVTLGADEFYLMGDNRGNSKDSRTEGPIPRAHLVGKVTSIYFATDFARIGKVE